MLDVYNDLGLTSWPLAEEAGDELYLCCVPQSVPQVVAVMGADGSVTAIGPNGT